MPHILAAAVADHLEPTFSNGRSNTSWKVLSVNSTSTASTTILKWVVLASFRTPILLMAFGQCVRLQQLIFPPRLNIKHNLGFVPCPSIAFLWKHVESARLISHKPRSAPEVSDYTWLSAWPTFNLRRLSDAEMKFAIQHTLGFLPPVATVCVFKGVAFQVGHAITEIRPLVSLHTMWIRIVSQQTRMCSPGPCSNLTPSQCCREKVSPEHACTWQDQGWGGLSAHADQHNPQRLYFGGRRRSDKHGTHGLCLLCQN